MEAEDFVCAYCGKPEDNDAHNQDGHVYQPLMGNPMDQRLYPVEATIVTCIYPCY